jgi:hypothetical protein
MVRHKRLVIGFVSPVIIVGGSERRTDGKDRVEDSSDHKDLSTIGQSPACDGVYFLKAFQTELHNVLSCG